MMSSKGSFKPITLKRSLLIFRWITGISVRQPQAVALRGFNAIEAYAQCLCMHVPRFRLI